MLNLISTWKIAIRALRRNIMRSTLTTLGIIIGVASVITMTEIGQGSSKDIQEKMASMGANNLLVMPGTASSGGVSFGGGSVTTLTPQDADAIMRECNAVSAVAPIVRVRTQVIYNGKNWVPSFIYGTTPSFLEVRDWTDLAEGEMFSERDIRNSNTVCMLGQTLVRELFGNESPIGHEVRVQNVNLRVIGVLSRKGANTSGLDQDDVLLAPWTTIKFRVSSVSATTSNQSSGAATTTPGSISVEVNSPRKLYPNTDPQKLIYPQPSSTQLANSPQPVRYVNVDQILVQGASAEEVPEAINQITSLLRERHRIRPGMPADFNIRDMTEQSKAQASTADSMASLLLCVALISLVVGGVGIMNIMLVSVTERTREIGLRMAVGARSGDILRQFLVESVFLCLLGGAIGIAVGRGGSLFVHLILKWPIVPSMPAIIASVAVSAFVGILFGYYPAWKASRLDPIDALRYE